MKVTVCFGNVKIVVPCGQGNMSIKELSAMAVMRYQKSLHQSRPLEKSSTNQRAEKLEAGDSMDSGAVNDLGVCQVDALTLARDGGLLDWDDKVIDVLDDRELLIAHYHLKDSPSNTSLSDQSSSTRSSASRTMQQLRCTEDSAISFQQQPQKSSIVFSPEFQSSAQPIDASTSQRAQHPPAPPVPCLQPSTVFPGSLPAPPPPIRSFKQTPSQQLPQLDQTGQATVSTFRDPLCASKSTRPAPPPPPAALLPSGTRSEIIVENHVSKPEANDNPSDRLGKRNSSARLNGTQSRTSVSETVSQPPFSSVSSLSNHNPVQCFSESSSHSPSELDIGCCNQACDRLPTLQPSVPNFDPTQHLPQQRINTDATTSFPTATVPSIIPRLPLFLSGTSSADLGAASLDTSGLSTVPEEDDSGMTNSGHSTPPCVCRADTPTENTHHTPTLKTSASLPKLSQFTSEPSQHPGLCNSSTDSNSSGPRPNRKVKRRRVPRPPPPPPPPPAPPPPPPPHMNRYSPRQQSPSSSGLDDEDTSDVDQSTIRRMPCRNEFASQSSASSHQLPPTYSTSIATQRPHTVTYQTAPSIPTMKDHPREGGQDLVGSRLDRKCSPVLLDETTFSSQCSSASGSLKATEFYPTAAGTDPDNQGSILPHWNSTTDCIPGYTPKELAEAERALLAEQDNSSNRGSERKLSMDEERAFSMKPPPPKRSPFTMLTKLSMLSPSNNVNNLEAPGTANEPFGGSGGGQHHGNDGGSSAGSDPDQGGLGWTGGSSSSRDGIAGTICSSANSSNHDNHSSSSGAENDGNTHTAAVEDEVIHMTELLSKRRESEARRHLMLAELEADIERDHRLQAAANAMALAAVSNLSPTKKTRVKSCDVHSTRHARHAPIPADSRQHNAIQGTYPVSQGASFPVGLREEDLTVSLTKTQSGLGFSLTTKPLKELSESRMNNTDQTTVCVKNILPGGAALKDGQLRLGDRILRIDDQEVSGKTQAQIVSMLRVKPVGSVVKLLVRRQLPCSLTVPRHLVLSTRKCPGCLGQKANDSSIKPCPDSCLYQRWTPDPYKQFRPQRQSDLSEHLVNRVLPCFPVFHPATTSSQLVGNNTSNLPSSGRPSERPTFRCASPTLPERNSYWLNEFPSIVTNSNYPSYPDVFILRLDISLQSTGSANIPVSTATNTNTAPNKSLIDTPGNSASRHMRLGVSVRETNSSRASKLAEKYDGDPEKIGILTLGRADEIWAGADSVYGGILVKGIIEGGAAHRDGRLRVGDELLEVNGVSLVNVNNPLGLLRSVLRQLTSPTREHQGQSANITKSSEPADNEVCESAPVPVVQLLVARQTRHRRSASGHTLASNSELWTEASSASTLLTTTACITSQQRHPATSHSSVDSSIPTEQNQLGGSSHAVQIAADVHSPRPTDEFKPETRAVSWDREAPDPPARNKHHEEQPRAESSIQRRSKSTKGIESNSKPR